MCDSSPAVAVKAKALTRRIIQEARGFNSPPKTHRVSLGGREARRGVKGRPNLCLRGDKSGVGQSAVAAWRCRYLRGGEGV